MPSPARIRSTIATLTAPPQDLKEVAVVHKALSDPTRLRMLQRLAGAPGTVSDRNWSWRFDWDMLGTEPGRVLGLISAASGRAPFELAHLP